MKKSIMTPADERPLIEGLRRGDSQAWDQLVRENTGLVRAVVWRIIPDNAFVEDVLQEVWLKVVKHIASFDNQAMLGTWLHRVALNYVLDTLRRRRCAIEPVSSKLRIVDARQSSGNQAMEAVEVEEMSQMVDRLLQGMPTDFCAVLTLIRAGLSVEEVATVLGLPRSTVGVRLHRARKELKFLLEAENFL